MLGLALAAALAGGTQAAGQDFLEAPSVDMLTERLREIPSLFAVEVAEPVTEDMLERGRLVAMGGSQRGGAAMACFTCHGVQGGGDGSGAFPRLAGMPGWYSYKQLMDYASGARPNAVMSGIAARLTEAEMEAVAAYYAVIDAPYPDPPAAEDLQQLQWGGQLAAIGSVELGIPACVNCHGPNGSGLPPSVPYLAGQYAEYIALQLKLWKAGVRDNDAMNVMEAIAVKMSEADMRAVGAYYERVRPQAPDAVVVVPEPEPQTPADLLPARQSRMEAVQ
jgi:cytochrome c553